MNENLNWEQKFTPIVCVKNTTPSPAQDVWIEALQLQNELSDEELCDISIIIVKHGDNDNYIINHVISTMDKIILSEKIELNLRNTEDKEKFQVFLGLPLTFCKDGDINVLCFEQGKEITLREFNELVQEWKSPQKPT